MFVILIIINIKRYIVVLIRIFEIEFVKMLFEEFNILKFIVL